MTVRTLSQSAPAGTPTVVPVDGATELMERAATLQHLALLDRRYRVYPVEISQG